jgi:hypothetical protein
VQIHLRLLERFEAELCADIQRGAGTLVKWAQVQGF